jgi:hypothetical protein
MVTIDPGEAFVDGWLARGQPTNIELAGDTAEQTIVTGWNPDATYDDQQHDVRDEADEVIVALQDDVEPTLPVVDIWTTDTDAGGVANAEDHRNIGPEFSENLVGRTAIDYGNIIVDSPDRLPITELRDGESIEIAVRVNDGDTLEVYRWGAFDASNSMAPTGLDVELLDGNDTVQESENTPNSESDQTPAASYENDSGGPSVLKLRAINHSGNAIVNPGVGAHFGYVVV